MNLALRIVVYAVAACLSFVLLGLVALIVVDKYWPASLWGAAPPIAADLALDANKPDDGTVRFNARLQERFPPGTDEKTLRQTLVDQGFHSQDTIPLCVDHGGRHVPTDAGVINCPSYDPRYLRFYWGAFPCSNQLVVTWAADRRGRVEETVGNYYYVCL